MLTVRWNANNIRWIKSHKDNLSARPSPTTGVVICSNVESLAATLSTVVTDFTSVHRAIIGWVVPEGVPSMPVNQVTILQRSSHFVCSVFTSIDNNTFVSNQISFRSKGKTLMGTPVVRLHDGTIRDVVVESIKIGQHRLMIPTILD